MKNLNRDQLEEILITRRNPHFEMFFHILYSQEDPQTGKLIGISKDDIITQIEKHPGSYKIMNTWEFGKLPIKQKAWNVKKMTRSNLYNRLSDFYKWGIIKKLKKNIKYNWPERIILKDNKGERYYIPKDIQKIAIEILKKSARNTEVEDIKK